MTDAILRAWLLAADDDFGGSIDGWEMPAPMEVLPDAPPARKTSRYQGVVWFQSRGRGYWRPQPYVGGHKRRGRDLPDTPENEERAAEVAARLAGWDKPRLKADNPRSLYSRRRGS